jgi:hypothetical protein
MGDFSKELNTILASEVFTNLVNSKTLKIVEFDAIIALLIKLKIPFDVEYSPGNRRLAESTSLSVYINPSTTLNFTINFEAGNSLFTGNTS